jgi:uncharacterized protein (TIGR03435 family)
MLRPRFTVRLLPMHLLLIAGMTAGSALAQQPNPSGQTTVIPVAPMAANADPAFEVATIRPSRPENTRIGFHLDGHRIAIENQTVERLIVFAYAIHPKQIIDAPDWISTDKYDIDGVPDVEGQPNLHQYQAMVRKLLADRFQLKFHREKRDLPIFALIVSKGGPKLARSASPGDLPDQTGNGGRYWVMKYTNNTLEEFTLDMQHYLDRPAVDQTGLTGRYDFTLRWSTNDTPSDDPNAGGASGVGGG